MIRYCQQDFAFEHLRSFKSSPALILSLQRPFSFLSPSRAPSSAALQPEAQPSPLVDTLRHLAAASSQPYKPQHPAVYLLSRRSASSTAPLGSTPGAMVAAATVDAGGQARTQGRGAGGRRSAIFLAGCRTARHIRCPPCW
jgi:hypothetical protein